MIYQKYYKIIKPVYLMKDPSFDYLKTNFMNNFFKILLMCFISLIFFSKSVKNNTLN